MLRLLSGLAYAVQLRLEGNVMRQLQMRNKAVHLQRITMQQYKFFILCRSRPFCFQGSVQHRHRDRLVFVPPQNCTVAYCQFQFLIVILRNKALYFRQQNFTDADAFRSSNNMVLPAPHSRSAVHLQLDVRRHNHGSNYTPVRR